TSLAQQLDDARLNFSLNSYETGDVTSKFTMNCERPKEPSPEGGAHNKLAVPVPDQCSGSAKLLERVAVAAIFHGAGAVAVDVRGLFARTTSSRPPSGKTFKTAHVAR